MIDLYFDRAQTIKKRSRDLKLVAIIQFSRFSVSFFLLQWKQRRKCIARALDVEGRGSVDVLRSNELSPGRFLLISVRHINDTMTRW
jgi:hypothetical protein